MARSSYVSSRRVVTRYSWPQAQLNFWTFIVLATASTILGIFAYFITVQNRMHLPVPWLFPFGVTVGALTLTFLLIELIIAQQGRLLPGVMMLGSFILFVLFLTGLIETAIELFGAGNVSSNCQRYVDDNQISGISASTLAWLEQNSICSSWYAAFSFWIIGCVFFFWMYIMAFQVSRGIYE